MITCPHCGQALPDRANYCARCGRAVSARPPQAAQSSVPSFVPPPPGVWSVRPPATLPAPRNAPEPVAQAPVWLLVLFWAGALVPLFFGLIYTIAAVLPSLAVEPGTDISAGEVQETAGVLAVILFLLVAVQVAGGVGLLLGRAWGRIVATVVCAVWIVTVIGIPLSVLALATMWRRAPA